MLVTTLGAMDRLSLDTYYGTQLEFTDGTEYGKFEVLLQGASLGYIDRLEVGCTEVTELWIFMGECLSQQLVNMIVNS